jgi:sugar O-acyltransferase (sialic acid O-acetyltransferase NeuD family)
LGKLLSQNETTKEAEKGPKTVRPQKIVILGAGGFARETLTVLNAQNKRSPHWEIMGFIDENPETHGDHISEFTVLGDLEWLRTRTRTVNAVCAIGNPKDRKRMVLRAEKLGVKFETIVHPTAELAGLVDLGHGDILCANSILTDTVILGEHVIINLACTVGHDVGIGDYCTLAPGVHISGHDVLHDEVEIGTGAVLIQGVEIGKGTVIGAGAVVIDNIPEGVVAVGVPARPIKKAV